MQVPPILLKAFAGDNCEDFGQAAREAAEFVAD